MLLRHHRAGTVGEITSAPHPERRRTAARHRPCRHTTKLLGRLLEPIDGRQQLFYSRRAKLFGGPAADTRWRARGWSGPDSSAAPPPRSCRGRRRAPRTIPPSGPERGRQTISRTRTIVRQATGSRRQSGRRPWSTAPARPGMRHDTSSACTWRPMSDDAMFRRVRLFASQRQHPARDEQQLRHRPGLNSPASSRSVSRPSAMLLAER